MPRMKPVRSKKISRGVPEMTSKPTAESTRPKAIEKIVFGMSSPPSPTKVAKASSISAKTSGGPKLSATAASGGAKRVKRMFATVPPMNDARQAVTSARSAWPLSASGRPSKVVATAVEAPGMPRVIDEIAPPYMAP